MPDHVQTLVSFTGSPEESSFFGISVTIEARAAPLISILLDGIEAARNHLPAVLCVCLLKVKDILGEMTLLLPLMYQNCTPGFFYLTLRPFLEGTKDLASIGLPNGVLFEEENGGCFLKFRGPSNAQSSMFAFIDIALGVSHEEEGSMTVGGGLSEDKHKIRNKNEFLKVNVAKLVPQLDTDCVRRTCDCTCPENIENF
jgi:indoleamine 2,3-dioxygenase